MRALGRLSADAQLAADIENNAREVRRTASARYSTIVIDPPWQVKAGPAQGAAREATGSTSLDLPYPTMSLDEIAALPIGGLAREHAHLYVWTINKYVEDTYALVRSWGFRPTTLLTWCKPTKGLGLGGAFCQTTEHILFGWRGRAGVERRHNSTWLAAPRSRHSAKPEAFLDIVESISPGPYLEMFARRNRLGWDTWGNEALNHVDLGDAA